MGSPRLRIASLTIILLLVTSSLVSTMNLGLAQQPQQAPTPSTSDELELVLPPDLKRLWNEASASYPGGDYEKSYIRLLSGRLVELNATMLPSLTGMRVGEFCFLAYVNGSWRSLPFIVYDNISKIHSRTGVLTFYDVPEIVGERTRVLIKMPTHPPEQVDPMKHVPPQGRGATVWYWVKIWVGGHAYPVLFVANGVQINKTCGYAPFQYYYSLPGRPPMIVKTEPPYPVIYAAKKGYNINMGKVLSIISTPVHPEKVEIEKSVSTEWRNQPLPDGGGGGPGSAEIVWLSNVQAPFQRSGKILWEPLVYTISGCSETLTYKTYPLSPNSGVDFDNIKLKKINIVVVGKPTPTSETDELIPSISLVVEVEFDTGDYVFRYASLYGLYQSGEYLGDYYVMTIDPSEEFPYGIAPEEITITINPLSCTPDFDWSITLFIGYMFELEYYDDYIPENLEYKGNYFPFYTYEPPGNPNARFATLVVPAGGTESNASFGVFPYLMLNNLALYHKPSDGHYTATMVFDVEVPPGFPGGKIKIKQYIGYIRNESFLDNVIELDVPENYNNYYKKFTFYKTITIDNLNRILTLSSNMLNVGTVQITLDSIADENMIIYLKINTSNNNYNPFTFRFIPILEIKHNNANYDTIPNYKWTLSPIINYEYIYDNYPQVLHKYISRYDGFINIYTRSYNIDRYGVLDFHLSTGPQNIMIDFSLQPFTGNILGLGWREFQAMGKINFFEVQVKVDPVTGSTCSAPGDPIVYARVATGGGIWEYIEKYGPIISIIIGILSYSKCSLSLVATAIDAVVLAVKYRDVVNINKHSGCHYGVAYYTVRALNWGWAPEGFQNNIVVNVRDGFYTGEGVCAKVGVTRLIVDTTEAGRVVNIWEGDLPDNIACLPGSYG